MSDTEANPTRRVICAAARVEEIRENQARAYHGGDCDCCEHWHQEISDLLAAHDAMQKRADTLLKELKTEESKFRLAAASLEDAGSRNEKLLSLLDRIQKDHRDWRCQCEDEAMGCSSCLLMQEAREEVSKKWNEFHRQERRGR